MPILHPATSPGPRGWDLLRRLRRSQRDPLAEWMDARETFGNVVCYRTGRLPVYLISHPDDVQRVLQSNWKNYRKGIFNQPLVPLLGSGLLTNEGESWLAQRRLLQPAFHREHLVALAEVMVEETQRLVEQWRALAQSGEPADVASAMHRLTLAIAGRTLLGTPLRAEDALSRAFLTAIQHVNYRARHPLALPDWVPAPRNLRYRRAAATLDRRVRQIVRERRERGGEQKDVLSLLLSARDAETGHGMDEEQLRDEVLTFLVAGHETAANMLGWTWHLLGQHPSVAERLRREADAVLGERAPTAEDLPKLSYARQILEESLRLYPPSVILPRQANGPDELGGYPVPGDAAIIISQFVVHRHPEFWPEPKVFNPDRFTPEQASGRHRFAFIPFGGGPHVCIGREFALMEGQLVVAMVARAFALEPIRRPEVVPEVAVTLRPRNLWMLLRAY